MWDGQNIYFCRADSVKRVYNGKWKCCTIQALEPTFSANLGLESAEARCFQTGHARVRLCTRLALWGIMFFLYDFFQGTKTPKQKL